ncbi:unnamed protein product [Chilo suppressalis]|uniref:Uncharacterized protein n=1 Tax=Chilo suppressalis TaxID=168631 RepID=A0ABN8B667_CHISP|nr:unnamed protein product [Chilo suppressalis]
MHGMLTSYCIPHGDQKWSCRGEDKQKLNEKKKQIQEDFKSECGLLIHVVQQGAGTTNDGNTARRFFSNADTSARITCLDKDLIERFHVVLQAIASGEWTILEK